MPPVTVNGRGPLSRCVRLSTLALRGALTTPHLDGDRSMRLTRGRGVPILLALAMLLTLAAAPVDAITLQRTWSAKVGSNGANGRVTLRAYTNGVGSISYALKGLRANATYSVQIRNGTCSNLGSVAARPPSVHTSTTGTVARTDNLLPWLMTNIWPTARHKTFIVRIVSGTSIRCGGFTFAHATRVAVPSIGIDIPVIRGTSSYPLCRVAMYLASVAQPREPGITFIYAHARTGMFLPLLTRWRIDHGASLIGKSVKVWTSDSYVSYYRITRVRKTSNAMLGVFSLDRERLWLQTSTGPNYTYAKLIAEASRYKTVKTTYSASHPTAHPVRC